MAESIGADLAAGLVGKLVSLAANEVIQTWNLHNDLDTLGKRFELIGTLLDDARNKNITMSTVQKWFDQLEELVNDTEALLDELAYEVTRRNVNNRRTVWDFFIPSKNHLIYRRKVAVRIKSIHASFNEIFDWAKDLGLHAVEHLNSTAQPTNVRYGPFYEDAKLLVGRDKDFSSLVQTVCNCNEQELHVVAIIGMGGQGKTTLARMVFHSDDTKMFTKRMWVTVSDDFDCIEILNQMVQSLSSKNLQLKNIQGLVNELEKNIKGERFLLVLDDVWNEESQKWENLRNDLLGVRGAKGSSVIVTTRRQEVIDAMQNCVRYPVEKLQEDESYELFKKIAFRDGGVSEIEPLADLGRNMVGRCGGLPLAIKALGHLLRSKKSEQEWREVQNSEIWKSKGVLSSLKLSYDNLPYLSLKRCFVLFSIIPKDTRIYKDELIQIWMALGFLLPPLESGVRMEDIGSSGARMEDTGNEYINILFCHSLLQDIGRDEFGNIESCKMHDLVHDLALDLSKHHSVTVKTGPELNQVSKATYLRLDKQFSDRNPTVLKRDFDNVRLLYAGACVFRDVLPYIPHLAVLVLKTDGFSVKDVVELPKSLRNMKYIKYLDISCLNRCKVPSYITEFYNLQTLRVWDLEELPKTLINLRHLYIKSYGSRCMLNGIERLTCLQTLPHFVVSKDQNCLLEQLEGLQYLRGKVKLYGLNDVANVDEASKAKLDTKSNIQSLLLNWEDGSREVESDMERKNESAMKGLEPHTNLKELIIEYFMGKSLVSWITKMTNLVKIRLFRCERCEELPSLGHLLPKLREMELWHMYNVRIIGSKCGAAGEVTRIYPSLTKLRLWNMPKLEEWVEEGDTSRDERSVQVFPKLEVLYIGFCSKLRRMPSFPSLKEFSIDDSEQILEEMSTKVSQGPPRILKYNSQSLSYLKLQQCPGLTCLTVGVGLEELRVRECPDLTSINAAKEGGCLRYLEIKRCPSLSVFDQTAISTLIIDEIPGALTSSVISFPNLTHLSLDGYESPPLPEAKSTLDFDHGHVSAFSALTRLFISDFKGLKALPNTIAKLPSLEHLVISNCKELERLPTFDQSHTIQRLEIRDCPILSGKCNKETGAEWYKIQNIPFIEISVKCVP